MFRPKYQTKIDVKRKTNSGHKVKTETQEEETKRTYNITC